MEINTEKAKTPLVGLLILYLSFLFYGALYPFHDWRIPKASILAILWYTWHDFIFLFDIIQNLLLFIPFGLLVGALILLSRGSTWQCIIATSSLSFIISLTIEVIQTFNPARIPSILDIGLNIVSGLLGGVMAVFLAPYYYHLYQQFLLSIQQPFKPRIAIFGATIWIGWLIYQLYPFVPTLHIEQIIQAIDPITLYFTQQRDFNNTHLLSNFLQYAALYSTGKLFIHSRRLLMILPSFILLTMVAKLVIVDCQLLTIEMIVGYMGLIALMTCFSREVKREYS